MVGEYLIIHIKFTSSSLAYSAPILDKIYLDNFSAFIENNALLPPHY
jgi:hypothetical protein